MDVRGKAKNDKRLIDAEGLRRRIIAFATGLHSEVLPVDTALMLLTQMQTIDAVPVVRCWECKKHCEANGKHYCKFWRMYCPDDSDFFCKAGERKEGAD